MSHIYIALVDTPGFFAALIRRYLKLRYIHVVISEEPTFREAYSVGRRNPAIPVFAGFTKENRDEILHTFPSAFYRICELDCTYAQKREVVKRLKEDYDKRLRIHYAVIGLPFILMGVPFYIKNQYTCSSYIGKILRENGICVSDKHFSLITPKDFYECDKLRVIFEGRLSEISTKTHNHKIKGVSVYE